MTVKHYGPTDTIETLDRSLSITYPPPSTTKDKTIQTITDRTEVIKYIGLWAEAEAFAASLGESAKWPATIGGAGLVISVNIVRKGGGNAELTATLETVVGSVDGSTSAAGAGAVGSTESNPAVSASSNAVQQSILLNPDFDAYTDNQLNALNMLAQGASLDDLFTTASGKKGTLRAYFIAQDMVADAKRVMRTPFELVEESTVEVSWRVEANTLIQASVRPRIVESIEGVAPLGGKRNFLLISDSARKENGEIQRVQVYKVSGVNGWDEKLYPN